MSVMLALKQVFQRWSYAVSAILLALASFVFLIFIPNHRLIFSVFGDSGLLLGSKLRFLIYLISGVVESLSLLAIINTIIVSVLFAVNAVLIIYFLKERLPGLSGKAFVSIFGGSASGVLSAGCAACGSFALSAILSALGAGGALALLPLRGGELGILSVALLGVSIYLITRKISFAKHICHSRESGNPESIALLDSRSSRE